MAKLKSKSNKFFGSKHSKKNIVFLPYKASMWDSLESIWKTAYEDKSYCNTYVVPIPYADIDANGKVFQNSNDTSENFSRLEEYDKIDYYRIFNKN